MPLQCAWPHKRRAKNDHAGVYLVSVVGTLTSLRRTKSKRKPDCESFSLKKLIVSCCMSHCQSSQDSLKHSSDFTKGSRTSTMSSWSLEGRNYCVTGGSEGIGLAIVRGLLAANAQTVIFCSRKPVDDLVEGLKTAYPKATIVHVKSDVATSEGRKALYEGTKAHVDNLHGLVNNVGINVRKTVLEQTDEEFTNIWKTNTEAAYHVSKIMFDLFDKEQGSTIVNVSSAAGVQSSGTGAAYGMSKAAMNQMTRNMACEWTKHNIRVNAITPWMTMTPMLEEAVKANPSQLDKVKQWTPLHRLGTPDEIAAPVVFLSMPCSGYITGQVLGVDGGLTAQGFDGPCVTLE